MASTAELMRHMERHPDLDSIAIILWIPVDIVIHSIDNRKTRIVRRITNSLSHLTAQLGSAAL